jgi:hypothetical protein
VSSEYPPRYLSALSPVLRRVFADLLPSGVRNELGIGWVDVHGDDAFAVEPGHRPQRSTAPDGLADGRGCTAGEVVLEVTVGELNDERPGWDGVTSRLARVQLAPLRPASKHAERSRPPGTPVS